MQSVDTLRPAPVTQHFELSYFFGALVDPSGQKTPTVKLRLQASDGILNKSCPFDFETLETDTGGLVIREEHGLLPPHKRPLQELNELRTSFGLPPLTSLDKVNQLRAERGLQALF